MKTGMTISCVGHAAALVFGLMAHLGAADGGAAGRSLPVSFISDKDFSQAHPRRQERAAAENSRHQAARRQGRCAEVGRSARAQGRRQAGNHDRTKPVANRSRSPSPSPSRIRSQSQNRPEAPEKDGKAGQAKPPEYKPDQIADLLKKDAAKDPPKPDDKPAPRQQVQNSTPIRSPSCSTSASRSARWRPPRASTTTPHSAPRTARRPRRCRKARSMLCARAFRAAGARRRASTPIPSSMSCSAFCSSRRLDGAGAGSGRRHGFAIRSGARRERQARAAVVPAVHDAQSPNITTSGKTSSSNSILTSCSAADHANSNIMTI